MVFGWDQRANYHRGREGDRTERKERKKGRTMRGSIPTHFDEGKEGGREGVREGSTYFLRSG